jgi:hypothetical protein
LLETNTNPGARLTLHRIYSIPTPPETPKVELRNDLAARFERINSPSPRSNKSSAVKEIKEEYEASLSVTV